MAVPDGEEREYQLAITVVEEAHLPAGTSSVAAAVPGVEAPPAAAEHAKPGEHNCTVSAVAADSDLEDQRPAARPRRAATPAAPPNLAPAQLLFWLAVAAVQPVFVALLGVLTRYLETVTQPPFQPLRVTVVILLFSTPVLFLFHTLPAWLLARWRRQQREKEQHRRAAAGQQRKGAARAPGPSGSSSGSLEGQGADGDGSDVGAAGGPVVGGGGSRDAGAAAVAGLARIPSLPGLSRLYDRHPKAHRTAVILAVTSAYLGVILLLNVAPKLVDPSVIMLVTMFTVVGVALVGRVWLGVPLPRPLVPAAAAMIGGALMILVPDIKGGSGTEGSLTTGEAWLGFAAAVGALCLTTVYLLLLQTFKHANLQADEVMYWLSGLCAVVVLPISLGVDGTDWGAQFRGMTGSDWAALLFCSFVAHNGSVLGIQYATRHLGANTVGLFMGLRLIASIVASKVILGATVIQTGVQIAGVVLVAASITCYMALRWWSARARQLRPAAR